MTLTRCEKELIGLDYMITKFIWLHYGVKKNWLDYIIWI